MNENPLNGFLMDQCFLLLQRLLRASASLGLQSRGEEGNTAGNRQQNGADGIWRQLHM